jgi:type IV pilus assembly protein PilC
MGSYLYKAVDSKGKQVKGKLEAKDEVDVSTQLAKLGYTPVSIEFKGEKASGGAGGSKKKFQKASPKALIIFTRQFATIVRAAVPIIEGIGVLAEQAEDPALKEALHQVIHDIEEGSKLSEAMARHPGVFSDLYVNTVMAGEAGGVLDKVLLRLAEVVEEEARIKDELQGALRYPIMVLSALFLAIYFLSIKVVPTFAALYGSLKSALPLPTQVLIIVSNIMRGPWRDSKNILLQFLWFGVIMGSVVGFVFGIKFAINTPVGRKWWDRFKFDAPVFGKIYNKIVMMRFASMLNVLYQAGISILKIMDIVKVTIGNVALGEEIDQIKRDVADGKGVSGGVLNSKLFPRMVGYMISIGEKSGSLSTMLDSLCEYYTMEVKTSMATLTSLIEPLMTMVLGFVVVGIALAIFMPMWGLIGAFKQSSS